MKKTVLTFGLISGALVSGMMLVTLPLHERIGFDAAEVIGYTTLVLASLLVFFGVRSYRENVAGGHLTFGQALMVGLMITLVSSICYVATWQVVYYKLAPGFGEKYAAHYLERQRAAGATDEELEAAKRQVQQFQVLYRNPLFNIAITFLEPLPIGVLASLITAGVLRRRQDAGVTARPATP
jgi:hypothetical protein